MEYPSEVQAANYLEIGSSCAWMENYLKVYFPGYFRFRASAYRRPTLCVPFLAHFARKLQQYSRHRSSSTRCKVKVATSGFASHTNILLCAFGHSSRTTTEVSTPDQKTGATQTREGHKRKRKKWAKLESSQTAVLPCCHCCNSLSHPSHIASVGLPIVPELSLLFPD